MWEDILKVQVLGSKQKVKQGIKPLPKAEKNDCIKWLKGLYDVFELNSHPRNFANNTISDWDKIPEHIACKIKHYLETQPAYEIDTEYYTDNKGVDLYSDNVIGIQFYFQDTMLMYINLKLNDITVLNMKIVSTWEAFFNKALFELDWNTNQPTFDAIKEICKYINRKDVFEYFTDFLDGKSRDNPEYAGLYNSWLDEGKLDW